MANQKFITDILKSLKSQYQEIIDDAIQFFAEFGSVHAVYSKEIKRLNETNNQLKTIASYKAEHGVYPQIKGYEDTKVYLKELQKIQSRSEQEVAKHEPEIIDGFIRRREKLFIMTDLMLHSLLNDRDASQFIATMMLRAPMPNDKNRCATNEINKPIYIGALSVSLLRRLMDKDAVEDEFIKDLQPQFIQGEHFITPEYEPEQLERFSKYVLTPILTAALIHNIGSYSPDAAAIYDGNRYKALNEEQRKTLISDIHEHTMNYLMFGLGKPNKENFKSEEEYFNELDAFQLTKDIIEGYSKSTNPRGNLLRVPMIYASFMLSTKPKHDYLITFKAFDILKSGIDKGVVYKPYAKEFLRMVGLYPLGCGIFFISKDSDVPERAVVTGLNPPDPSSAIVKRLTRKQVKFDDHTQVCASKNSILSNRDARTNSRFDANYFKKQFPNGYFWNPSEVWELDLDHKQFWRRDNSITQN
ncbi:MAG: hypothetical protein HWE10_10595 [Gammaproteobacteria bacterium]|nr:hypothetical protein [Gammaproteobacteria bacterium]